jgi:peroxiredoxin
MNHPRSLLSRMTFGRYRLPRLRGIRPDGLRCSVPLTLGLVLVVLAMPGCGWLQGGGEPAVATVGERAPDFELRAVGTDEPIRLSGLRGKPVVLNFFCSCGLCYDLAHAWRRAQGKLGSAQMLAIMHNHDTFNPVNVRNFREGTEFKAPILADLNSKTAIRYRSFDCPMTWVIDAKGIVRYRNESRTDPAEKIVKGALQALEPG